MREYRLQLDYRFRVVNQKGQVLVPPNEINLTRDITFDDSNVLAKDLEENLLWRDMNNDLVNQIMRRLSIIKPKNPDVEEDWSNAAQGRTTRRAPRTRVAPFYVLYGDEPLLVIEAADAIRAGRASRLQRA